MLNNNFLPITVIGIVFIILMARGCGGPERIDSYNSDGVGFGVSSQSSARLGEVVLDLTQELDPAQVPEIIKSSYLEGAKNKLEGKELISFVIQDASQKISSISSIDLNEDDIPDPIFIAPEGDEERMTFSVRVPDPGLLKTVSDYPNSPDGWQDVAEKKAIEVLHVTVFPRILDGELKRFDVEAKPNAQVYENHSNHSYASSFMSTYFTMRMIDMMFFNPFGGWYGPGFYGNMGYYGNGYYNNNYGGRNVNNVKSTRTTYKKSSPRSTAMKTNSGKSANSSLSSQKSSSISKYKASAISKRNSSVVKKASGFGGKASSTAKTSSSWGSSSQKASSSSWGRSSGRSSWGGGGSRGGK
jgi:hypothetical protein